MRKSGPTDFTTSGFSISDRHIIDSKHSCEPKHWCISKTILHWSAECWHKSKPLSAWDPWTSKNVCSLTHPNGQLRCLYTVCIAIIFYPRPIFLKFRDSSLKKTYWLTIQNIHNRIALQWRHIANKVPYLWF